MPPPRVVILAGPNGAGKSTIAPRLLQGALSVDEFVNADTIARGLSAFAPETMAIQAGKTMLRRLRELANARTTFAFETTLASRSFAPWISSLIRAGYDFNLVFLWLPTPEIAISRVSERVRLGGHAVSEEIIRRRYASGLKNFFALYAPLASAWCFYDNSVGDPAMIAEGARSVPAAVQQPAMWEKLLRTYGR